MAAFTITTPTNAIQLDRERRGAVAFTLANQTGRSLRTRASVQPFEPASSDWFKIEGDSERLLPLGASENYTVRIAVPQDASPGPRSFRLDVVSVDRPDDEWGQGPSVGFEVQVIDDGPPPARGYAETVTGAVVGAFAGILLAVVIGFLFWIQSGLRISDALLLPIFGGEIVSAVALAGAIGVFGALTMRAILRPEPWHTALAYLVPAFVLTLLLQIGLALALPAGPARSESGAQIFDPTTSFIVVRTFPPLETGFLTRPPILVTFPPPPPFTIAPPPVTIRPPTSAPPTAPPTPEPPSAAVVLPLLFFLSLIAAALAALAARAFTRWRALGTL
jgi:hypothetical protein